MRVTPGFIIAAGLLVLPSAAAAQAGFSNAGLPKPAQVRTLPLPAEFGDPSRRGFLHSFRLSVDLGTSITEKRRQPTRLKQNSYGTQLGLSFGIGSMGFASVTGNV